MFMACTARDEALPSSVMISWSMTSEKEKQTCGQLTASV